MMGYAHKMRYFARVSWRTRLIDCWIVSLTRTLLALGLIGLAQLGSGVHAHHPYVLHVLGPLQ